MHLNGDGEVVRDDPTSGARRLLGARLWGVEFTGCCVEVRPHALDSCTMTAPLHYDKDPRFRGGASVQPWMCVVERSSSVLRVPPQPLTARNRSRVGLASQ